MKRLSILLSSTLLSILLLFLLLSGPLSLDASAHPGKTDGNGGHTDSDTGEYHYHHGYPAHDHYDMDGDGMVDCPYNFDDQTDHSAGSNGGSNADRESADSIASQKAITAKDVLKAMLVYILPAVMIGASTSHLLSYLFFMIWGDAKGCSVTIISLIAISVIAYIVLIILELNS